MEGRCFFNRLMHWFSRNRRNDPWNGTDDPYTVWISEVMLQQTVVSAVKPYFEAWMGRFPTLFHVASSPEEEVLRMWEGLGYYSRARNIHKTARILTSEGRRSLPSTYKELRSLPGIGDNTARAVLSLAFGQKYPVLDANVRKIFMRFFLEEEWSKETASRVDLFVREGMEGYPPGRVNEALMQLGQAVCLRKRPRCPDCPLVSRCQARLSGREDSIPPPLIRDVTGKKTVLLIPVWNREVGILRKREGIGRGLWTFLNFSYEEGRVVLSRLEERGRTDILPMTRQIHTYTRFRDELFPYLICFRKKEDFKTLAQELDFQPVDMDKLDTYPFLTAYRKITEEIKTLLTGDISR